MRNRRDDPLRVSRDRPAPSFHPPPCRRARLRGRVVRSREGSFDPRRIRDAAFAYYPRLQRVETLVREHYDEPLPLTRVARAACLEATSFSRFFHQKTGVCFHDWLNWVRLGQAVRLMQRRDSSITEIAFAVGFGTLRSFERTCKRCLGLTPSEVKARVRPC